MGAMNNRNWTIAAAMLGTFVLGLAPASAALAASERLCPEPIAEAGQGWATGQVRVTFLGVSSLLIDDGGSQILVDGFFTRPGRLATLFGKVGPDEAVIAAVLRRAHAGRIKAVIVAHGHHDHALDAATVAAGCGARLIGSETVGLLAEAANWPFELARPNKAFRVDRFRITPLVSPHATCRLPTPCFLYAGTLKGPLSPPAHSWRYKSGVNYSYLVEHEGGLRLLVHPSAAAPDGGLKGADADVVFLGAGALGRESQLYTETYWSSVVTEPTRLVVPIHWDDFTRSLGLILLRQPWPLDRADRARDRLATQAVGRCLHWPKAFETLVLEPGLEGAVRDLCGPASPER